MNPRAIQVMAEAGVDISEKAGYRSKHLDELKRVPLDYVVTVCDNANETCPAFPGKVKRLHVSFDDPPRLAKGARSEEEALDNYRRVRDEIRSFIESLEERLASPSPGTPGEGWGEGSV